MRLTKLILSIILGGSFLLPGCGIMEENIELRQRLERLEAQKEYWSRKERKETTKQNAREESTSSLEKRIVKSDGVRNSNKILRSLWTFSPKSPPHGPAHKGVCCQPCIDDGIVYFGSLNHTFYALDAVNGKELWNFGTYGPIESSPIVANNTVFFGSDDENFYALDAKTGKKKWAFGTRGLIWYKPCVADGIVYFGSDDDHLYALDAKTGKELWKFSVRNPKNPCVVDGIVYFGSDDDHLYALDAKIGVEKWSFKKGGFNGPCIENNLVYFGSDKSFFALNAKTGGKIWEFNTENDYIKSVPCVADGIVYFGDEGGSIYSLDAQTGQQKWRVNFGGNIYSLNPTVKDGILYFSSYYFEGGDRIAEYKKNLFALNAKTGQKLWETNIYGCRCPPPCVGEGKLFVGINDPALHVGGTLLSAFTER